MRFSLNVSVCTATLVIASLVPCRGLADDRTVTFQFRSPSVGERVWQHVTMFANLTTTYAQSGQAISQANRTVATEQIRRLVILQTAQQHSSQVRVTFEKASQTLTERGHEPQIRAQSVAGKSYVVSRPDAPLQVIYEDGSLPPEEELEIVRTSMQAVGRTNPLMAFLRGRTVRIGDQLEMPAELAGNLLGWKSEFGPMQQVTLRLSDVRDIEAARCGVFDVTLVGAPLPGQTSGTRMGGEICVEIPTCRTLSASMQAQLRTHQQRGPDGHTFTVSHRGQAHMHTQARFLPR